MILPGIMSSVNSRIAAGAYPTWTSPDVVRRAVTISRQAGCGAREIAEKLALKLQAHGDRLWTVYDRDLVGKVLEDHRLPKYLATHLPEYRKPAMEDVLEDLFARHPPQSNLIHQTAETILGLAEVGNAILIGRGGNIITAQVPHVLHVRLIAPLDLRIEHARQAYGLAPLAARNFCLREDLGRERYLHKHFDADINDPLWYHLVINTALMPIDTAASLIEEALFRLDTIKPDPAFPEKEDMHASTRF